MDVTTSANRTNGIEGFEETNLLLAIGSNKQGIIIRCGRVHISQTSLGAGSCESCKGECGDEGPKMGKTV
jgi:hypothetical protein